MVYLWMSLPLLLAATGVYLAWRSSLCRRPAPRPTDRALEILAERFAQGEIDADQYRRMKEELDGPLK